MYFTCVIWVCVGRYGYIHTVQLTNLVIYVDITLRNNSYERYVFSGSPWSVCVSNLPQAPRTKRRITNPCITINVDSDVSSVSDAVVLIGLA